MRYDHPDAVLLSGRVQQEYIERYGDPDRTPMDPADFDPPRGLYLIGYLDGEPVATGGWRAQDHSPEGYADGDAELKRMYVVPGARGRGLARRVLAELERSAAAAGRRRMVLETGTRQPEAIALYTSVGYAPVTKFGIYRDDPLSVCLGRDLTPAAMPSAGRLGTVPLPRPVTQSPPAADAPAGA
ncbi:acetyltransferase [Streptantibioticus cattleyicolor NRRL 8057 = DSM 46488]|uniref:Acetyltransferase n=1 Tax=Streptantibioticus cattleyicolor (strain ATCC 35852 / DSM 46488 / JCM 4925 / NBRC 14057 / NRRL 8057) TaxID=1003195 RepID=F8JPK7_STREN|nr:acetyltransferase [Streptantibioticus cattleyicolor NRRL 8057 = DSM 46488]MYS62196.1 GNAT family N-acetyltransferase [Streptomyces sp. SID5468]CCB78094.1 Acetyltransferase [Streptantibioticus cattleyicolor NRRL 8057 = DSM 46488]